MNDTTADIASMTRSHLRQVMSIDAKVYSQPWSRKLWTAELDRDHRICLVAEHHGVVVGYVGSLVADQDLHIMTIVANPDHQRQGIASRLLVAVICQGLAAGATALTLEVRAGNDAAKALYRRFGIAPAGLRRGYYEPDNEDALVMWAHDIDCADYLARLDRIQNALEPVA